MKILKTFFYKIMYAQITPTSDVTSHKPGSGVKAIREAYRFTPQHSLSPGNSSRGISFKPYYDIDPFWVSEACDVYLVGPYGLPINSKGKILKYAHKESVKKILGRTVRHMGFIRFLWTYAKVIFRRRNYDVESGLHLVPRHGYMPGVPNYSHWLLESLPQLYALEAYSIDHVIINSRPLDWQLQSLEMLGFRASKICVHNGDLLRVKKILFTSIRSAASSGSDRDPRLRQWLKKKMLKKEISQPVDNKRIFISRQNMPRGHITNFPELEKVLAKYSVEVYEPGKNGLQNDLAVFEHATLLIAPHGAGLANMILTRKTGVAVIEISGGEKWEADLFYHTAMEMNYEFESVQAEVGARTPEFSEPWIVDLAQLESAIAAAVSRSSDEPLRPLESKNEFS